MYSKWSLHQSPEIEFENQIPKCSCTGAALTLMLIQEEVSQPHAGPSLAVWQVALMFCLTEEQDPWPRFSATLGPHWRWHSTPPLRKDGVCDWVWLCYVRRIVDTDRCMYVDISWCKQRQRFICQRTTAVNRSLFSFCVRWCRLCCFLSLADRMRKL